MIYDISPLIDDAVAVWPGDTAPEFRDSLRILAISGDFQIDKCSWCPNWFCFGVGTGRRKSSLYCSDRCRKAAHRAGYKRG